MVHETQKNSGKGKLGSKQTCRKKKENEEGFFLKRKVDTKEGMTSAKRKEMTQPNEKKGENVGSPHSKGNAESKKKGKNGRPRLTLEEGGVW